MSLLTFYKSVGQIYKDTTACLIRYKKGGTTFFKIPMTKYCFVEGAALAEKWSGGWTMKWDVVKNENANLLFLEMNSTDVEGWLNNEDVGGSVQLVFELTPFKDSINLNELTYNTKGLHIINNFGGVYVKKQYLNGMVKLMKSPDGIFITSFINLLTEKPNTKQQIILNNKEIPSLTFDQYQECENKVDSIREAENDLIVNAITKSVAARDSIWEIENQRIKDSLKLHPYKGEFRVWVSSIDKAGNSRITYSITADSLVIKEGPCDFIYLAKSCSQDSVYFERTLTPNEKVLLTSIDRSIEFDTLKASYTNFCIIDGSILSFSFESAKFSKDVTVSNYYNDSIAKVVKFVNKVAPKRYQIWYNKETLLKEQNECNR